MRTCFGICYVLLFLSIQNTQYKQTHTYVQRTENRHAFVLPFGGSRTSNQSYHRMAIFLIYSGILHVYYVRRPPYEASI